MCVSYKLILWARVFPILPKSTNISFLIVIFSALCTLTSQRSIIYVWDDYYANYSRWEIVCCVYSTYFCFEKDTYARMIKGVIFFISLLQTTKSSSRRNLSRWEASSLPRTLMNRKKLMQWGRIPQSMLKILKGGGSVWMVAANKHFFMWFFYYYRDLLTVLGVPATNKNCEFFGRRWKNLKDYYVKQVRVSSCFLEKSWDPKNYKMLLLFSCSSSWSPRKRVPHGRTWRWWQHPWTTRLSW